MTRLKLQCAEIIHTLRYKPILMNLLPDGTPAITEPDDPLRKRALTPLINKIHQSQKFIFDSGSDKDERTVTAVRETAVNMMESGLFHQPHPIMWIEDPFEESPDTYRNYYLAEEKCDVIKIWFFCKLDWKALGANDHHKMIEKRVPNVCFAPVTMELHPKQQSDKFLLANVHNIDESFAKILAEVVYSYKKLIVTLNTENLLFDKVSAGKSDKRHWDGNPRTRPYDHTVIRIPLDVPYRENGLESGEASGNYTPRRKHLVRGFIWGKHTRPVEQQRWIKAYWRGDAEIATVQHSHYEVR